MNRENLDKVNSQLIGTDPQTILKWAFDTIGSKKLTLSNSLSIEDMVLTDMALKLEPSLSVFTLDTGRLFQETYDLMEKINSRYKIALEILFPECSNIKELVSGPYGPNLFYYSLENRKECCKVRKLEPLGRKLSKVEGWICGLRQEQSVTRQNITPLEWDTSHDIYKINPLAEWSEDQVWDYIKENNVPFSTLYNKGYASIGCNCCTRAVKNGEDVRAGRWWWENPDQKECGLHIK